MISAEVPGGAIVVCAWAFLPNKMASTYMKLWSLIYDKVEAGPKSAVFDMERAAYITFGEKFPAAKVSDSMDYVMRTT